MKNRINRIFSILMIFAFAISAKAQFADTVRVVYEKKINVHKLLEKYGNEWTKERIKHFDKFQVENYEYTGTPNKSIYKYKPKSEDEEPKRSALWGYNGTDNIVYNDYSNNTCTLFKLVYEEKMLVQDTLKKLEWKLSNEIRTIAGYKCRKATTTINDSVTIFAFYAQELLSTGGPETFNGLPGMILGLAIPRMHTTWFAVSVDTSGVNTTAVTPPTKGKKNTYSTLYVKLSEALKDWGKMKDLYLWINSI